MLRQTATDEEMILTTTEAMIDQLVKLGVLRPRDLSLSPKPEKEFKPIPYSGEDPSHAAIRLRGER